MCVDLIRTKKLNNLGELQKYLREQDASVRLTTQAFNQDEMHGLKCLDIDTGQNRNHWLMISAGHDEIEKQFRILQVSDEINETRLQRDTGILVREIT